ncbi:hypothetical protein G6K88_14175 [Agrobacterium rhizogenes]|uniref:hypothetical protein n=1 Tax=Rhizobium rhizogenes TaxID=359 RepID=UPI00115EDA78|nr:hypothetical protein [Rhizobium rhizogenes]NTI03167.1 hypothetical protein [Rhizobium rhizogenes]NTI09971.1 hypothetical protein [Rhizobium rhizogenes]TRB21505.1 hypothetical protein EXN70_21600 [Rhizobium rhizogenes]
MEKMFEIIANGTSYGIYSGKDKMSALETQTVDAGYRDIADLLEKSGQSLNQYLAEVKAVEVEIRNIRINFWEEDKVAVYFKLCLDDKTISTLEWIDSDGDLEITDSHIESAHDFSSYLKDFTRNRLAAYLADHGEDIDELFEALAA